MPLTTALLPNATTVTVASSAGGTPLIGVNPARQGLIIANRSAVVLTILPSLNPAVGVPVAGASGFGIDIAAGASLILGPLGSGVPFPWTAGIQAIAASATAVVTVLEF